MKYMKVVEQARDFISKDRLDKAIKIIKSIFPLEDGDVEDQLIHISGWLENYKKKSILNLPTERTLDEIRFSLITLVRQIEELQNLKSTVKPISSFENFEILSIKSIFSEPDASFREELVSIHLNLFQDGNRLRDFDDIILSSFEQYEVGLALLGISSQFFYGQKGFKKELIEKIVELVFSDNEIISYLAVYALFTLSNCDSPYPGILKIQRNQFKNILLLLWLGKKDDNTKVRLVHILSKSVPDYSFTTRDYNYISLLLEKDEISIDHSENDEVHHHFEKILNFYIFNTDVALSQTSALALGRGQYNLENSYHKYQEILKTVDHSNIEFEEALAYFSRSQSSEKYEVFNISAKTDYLQLKFICGLFSVHDIKNITKILLDTTVNDLLRVGCIVYLYNNSESWENFFEEKEEYISSLLTHFFGDVVTSKDDLDDLDELFVDIPQKLKEKIEYSKELVYDVRFPEIRGGKNTKACFIIKVNKDKKEAFENAIRVPEKLDLRDFGEILHSCWGEPSNKIKKEMNEKYGMYDIEFN